MILPILGLYFGIGALIASNQKGQFDAIEKKVEIDSVTGTGPVIHARKMPITALVEVTVIWPLLLAGRP